MTREDAMAHCQSKAIVHFDTDNEEWGRVVTDGKIIGVSDCDCLVEAFVIRANILVPVADLHVR